MSVRNDSSTRTPPQAVLVDPSHEEALQEQLDQANRQLQVLRDEETPSHVVEVKLVAERQPRRRWLLEIFGLLGILVAVGVVLGVVLGPSSGSSSSSGKVTGGSGNVTFGSTPSPTPIPPPRCFQGTEELHDAVDSYLEEPSNDTLTARSYGWPIGTWCVSNIQNFSRLFSVERNANAAIFNEDLSAWDTSAAKDMFRMFSGAREFNSDLSNWNVSSVVDMMFMFDGAASFASDIAAWDVSSVVHVAYMFNGAAAFASDLSEWNVSKMSWATAHMFAQAESFNSDLSNWDMSNVQNTMWMFTGASSFRQNLCLWGEKLPADVNFYSEWGSMFSGTACPYTGPPFMSSSPPGPFCFPCSK